LSWSNADKRPRDSISSRHQCRQLPTSAFALRQPKTLEFTKAGKLAIGAPYLAEAPDTLKSASFIEKDSKRFPDPSGWDMPSFYMTQRLIRSARSGAIAHSEGTFATSAIRLVTAKDSIFTGYVRTKQIVPVSAFQQGLKIQRRIYGDDKSRSSTNEGGPDFQGGSRFRDP